MKKDYETPTAEKMDFNYAENVTASGTKGEQDNKCHDKCGNQTYWGPPFDACQDEL